MGARWYTNGWLSLLCLLALWLGSGEAWAQARPVVRLGYADHPFEPYLLGEGSLPGKPPGSMVSRIRRSAAELGVELQLVREPIPRLLVSLERGSLDGIFPFSYTPERIVIGAYPLDKQGELLSSQHLMRLGYYLYGAHDLSLPANADSWAQLAPFRLGAVKDTAVGELLAQRGLSVTLTRTPERSLEMLLRGRLDLFVGPRYSTELVLARLDPAKRIRRFGQPLLARDYYLVFRQDFYRQQPELCQLWWQLLATPEADQ